MTQKERIRILSEALQWSLKHGVKAVLWSQTGYWQQAGYDGMEIMPPADLHAELDQARANALRGDSK